MTTNNSFDFFTPKYITANKEKNNGSQENQGNQNDNSKDKEKENDNGKHNGWDKNKDKGSDNKGNNGLHLGWYKRADHPKNPANTGDLNDPTAYEIINYINDVSLNNAEVLMTSDREGKYNTAYTYGLERISVDNLNVEDSFKEEPLFYLYDGRGNTTELTDNRGVARDRYRYDPYGVPLPKATIGPNPWYTENPYRYNGEDYDITTGLQYLRARYYEPNTGRFLSRDSYLGNVMEPLTLNRYIYVKNNPIMYNDPSGNIPLLAITAGIGALAGGIAGAVYGGVTSYKETGSIDWKKVGKDALIGGVAGLAVGAGVGVASAITGWSLSSIGVAAYNIGTKYSAAIGTTAGMMLAYDFDVKQMASDFLQPENLAEAAFNVLASRGGGVKSTGKTSSKSSKIKITKPNFKVKSAKIRQPIVSEKKNCGTEYVKKQESTYTSGVIGETVNPKVWRGTKVVNGTTVLDDVGAFGEHIAEDMLVENGWKDFTYIKNGSDNGIDIIARGPNGQIGFFEVKTSSIGKIPSLSSRQENMNNFVDDVLSNAANGTGRYQNIDSATRNAARNIYDEFLSNPSNVSGNVIGVDLKSGTIKISRWER